MDDRDVWRVLEDLVGQVERPLVVAGLEGISRGREDLLGAVGRRGIRGRRGHVDRLRVVVDDRGLCRLSRHDRCVIGVGVAAVQPVAGHRAKPPARVVAHAPGREVVVDAVPGVSRGSRNRSRSRAPSRVRPGRTRSSARCRIRPRSRCRPSRRGTSCRSRERHSRRPSRRPSRRRPVVVVDHAAVAGGVTAATPAAAAPATVVIHDGVAGADRVSAADRCRSRCCCRRRFPSCHCPSCRRSVAQLPLPAQLLLPLPQGRLPLPLPQGGRLPPPAQLPPPPGRLPLPQASCRRRRADWPSCPAAGTVAAARPWPLNSAAAAAGPFPPPAQLPPPPWPRPLDATTAAAGSIAAADLAGRADCRPPGRLPPGIQAGCPATPPIGPGRESAGCRLSGPVAAKPGRLPPPIWPGRGVGRLPPPGRLGRSAGQWRAGHVARIGPVHVARIGPCHVARVGPVHGHGRSSRRGPVHGHGGPGHAAAARPGRGPCHPAARTGHRRRPGHPTAATGPATAPAALGVCQFRGTQECDKPQKGDAFFAG